MTNIQNNPLPFTPTPDVATIIDHLLDIYERRDGAPKQAVRVRLSELSLPGYNSQIDPTPRITSNEQLTQLTQQDYLSLRWLPGETGHLLEQVTLNANQTEPLYTLLDRQPLAQQRQQLREQLLGDRFHLSGWRRKAVEHCLKQIQEYKSPNPFSLTNSIWNQDLITTLLALPDEESQTEIPYRLFSVRTFNDSKRFEQLKDSVARLARRHKAVWYGLPLQDVLRELGLVPNPSHLYLYGPWTLTDSAGQVMSLAEFTPSVGIPAMLASRVRQVNIAAKRVVCVENLASFYELVKYEGPGLAAICLWGNPSPVARHLLRCVAVNLPDNIPLQLWADIDYGGLNILTQLRREVSPQIQPYRMDIDTLDTYARWGQPLSANDVRNLTRLRNHTTLSDMTSLIDEMLLRELKLEQEAVVF